MLRLRDQVADEHPQAEEPGRTEHKDPQLRSVRESRLGVLGGLGDRWPVVDLVH